MARIRTIKPDFFKHDDLAELPALTRLLFIGLWTQADREGRLYDRPKRLKAELFPYEDYDVETGLQQLAAKGFIIRFMPDGGDTGIIQIPNFLKHQVPNNRESASTIPPQACFSAHMHAPAEREGEKEREKEKEFEQEYISKEREGGDESVAGYIYTNEKVSLEEEDFLPRGESDKKPDGCKNDEGCQAEPVEALLVLPWDTVAFKAAWNGWKQYRAEINKPVKPETEQAALLDLTHLCKGVEDTALKIITKSIANNWQGLFPLNAIEKHETPNNRTNHKTQKQQQHSDSATQRLAARMADRIQRAAG